MGKGPCLALTGKRVGMFGGVGIKLVLDWFLWGFGSSGGFSFGESVAISI